MSTVIVLRPDARYVKHRPSVVDPHLTLGYFGDLRVGSPQVAALRWVTERAAERLVESNVRTARISGRAVFDIHDDYPETLTPWAVVDLVDGWFVYQARTLIEAMTDEAGVRMDRSHGFTPHMTVDYTEDPSHKIVAGTVVSFTTGFSSIGVWSRDERWEFPL